MDTTQTRRGVSRPAVRIGYMIHVFWRKWMIRIRDSLEPELTALPYVDEATRQREAFARERMLTQVLQYYRWR